MDGVVLNDPSAYFIPRLIKTSLNESTLGLQCITLEPEGFTFSIGRAFT